MCRVLYISTAYRSAPRLVWVPQHGPKTRNALLLFHLMRKSSKSCALNPCWLILCTLSFLLESTAPNVLRIHSPASDASDMSQAHSSHDVGAQATQRCSMLPMGQFSLGGRGNVSLYSTTRSDDQIIVFLSTAGHLCFYPNCQSGPWQTQEKKLSLLDASERYIPTFPCRQKQI